MHSGRNAKGVKVASGGKIQGNKWKKENNLRLGSD